MIEILFHLLVHELQNKDRAELVPLAVVIPDIQDLRGDPERYLDKAEIVIGPNSRRFTAMYEGSFLGLFMGFVAVSVVGLTIQAAVGWENVGVSVRIFGAVAGLLMLVIIVIAVAQWARRWYVGGYIRLRRHSVEFEYRERSIFCPWSLFRVDLPFVKEQDQQVTLRINPAAREHVKKMDNYGESVADGLAVSTNWFRFASDNLLVVRNLYAVQPSQLANLLHFLGQRLS
ncbi:MAG TPA: hypothetical protein VKS79_04705 [Gemmataceae bacterium]|nr:hypothetical protein [Gemmataceae bacterium]